MKDLVNEGRNLQDNFKKSLLNEVASILLSNEFGGYEDTAFLKVVWKMSIEDLQELLIKAESDLSWLKKNSTKKGILGLFPRKDIQILSGRIKYIGQIIDKKQNDSNFIPDSYR
jgi:hypothetical protein